MLSEIISWIKDSEYEIGLDFKNFFAVSNRIDRIYNLLRGKYPAVNDTKMQLPTKFCKLMFTFLSIDSIYYSTFMRIGITYDEFYNFVFIERSSIYFNDFSF